MNEVNRTVLAVGLLCNAIQESKKEEEEDMDTEIVSKETRKLSPKSFLCNYHNIIVAVLVPSQVCMLIPAFPT